MDVLQERIIQQCLKIYGNGDFSQTAVVTDNFGTRWKNPDNIAFGELGHLFFMLELYKQTKHEQLWNDILNRLQKIEQYCSATSTNNYSLYTGRLGLSKFLLELFRLTGMPLYLSKSVKLCYTYFAERPGQLRFRDNTSLIDGFAGIMLFCLALYKEAKHDWLLDVIKKGVHFLIGSAELNGRGMYWNGLTNANNRQIGWGYGCSGIALVFLELASQFNSRYFLSFADMAFKYEDDCLQQYNIDHSLVFGHAGIGLVRMYAGLLSKNETYIHHWENAVGQPGSLTTVPALHELSCYALSEYSLAFRQAYRLTQGRQYQDAADNFTTVLLDRLESEAPDIARHAGIFGSLTGIGYFLLSHSDAEGKHSMVVPGINARAPIQCINTGNDDADIMKEFQVLPFDEYVIRKNFRNSFSMVEREYAVDVATFLNKSLHCPVNEFAGLVKQLDKQKLAADLQEELQGAFEKEYFTVKLKQSMDHTSFPGEQAYLEKVNFILQLSEEELLDLELKVCDKACVVSLEKEIQIDQPLSDAVIKILMIAYGAKSYSMRVNMFNELEVSSLYSVKLVLDQFKEPAPVRLVLNKLIHFFSTQSEISITALKESFDVESDDELRAELRNAVMEKIKFLFLSDLLVADIDHASNPALPSR